MAKVLGNDPFLRGAPARPGTEVEARPAAPPPPKPAPKPRVESSKVAPREWPTAARSSNEPARASVRGLMSSEAPVLRHVTAPTEVLPEGPVLEEPPDRIADSQIEAAFGAGNLTTPPARLSNWEPTAHAGAPELIAKLEGLGIAHRGSPDVVSRLEGPGTPHRGSPEVVARVVGPGTAHRGSPEVVSRLDELATAHRDSPEVVSVLDKAGTAHRGSPEVARLDKDFVPHPNVPELKAVLGKGVTPHHHSPVVAAVLEGAATAHRDSPQVIANLREDTAVAHALSPEVLEVRSAGTMRPLVVEIIEESAPDARMSEREISPAQRHSGPSVAIGVAREIFAGGIARPMAGAARGLFKAARTALGIAGSTELDVWGKDVALARSLESFSDFVYERYFRVTVEGADHVPAGACILVANHSGALPLDGPMLHLALRRERADLPEARWLVEDQIFHAPFVGVLANRLGAVRASPENATRLLEEQRPVAVFPEGIQGLSKKFTQRYQLKRFGRGGYVKLAMRLKVPIVPVAIVGAEESMPLLARLPAGLFGLPYLPITPLPLPARWQIRFGPPLDVSDAPANAEEDLAWVARTNDRTRDTIEGMLTAMLRARTRVF